jgi:hypothetical protein
VAGTTAVTRAIKPGAVTNAQTVSGSIRAARGVRPTTQITYTTAVAGSIRKLVVTPTGLTNTQTVSGTVRRLARVIPTSTITNSNVVTARVVRRAVIRPTTTVTNTNTVSSGVLVRRGILPSSITSTFTVSGSFSSTRIRISVGRLHPGKIVHTHRGRTTWIGNTERIQLTPANAEIAVGDRGVIEQ